MANVIVADSSTMIVSVLDAGPARERVRGERIHVPHLVDSEFVQFLRRAAHRGELSEGDAVLALDDWRRLRLRRTSIARLVGRIWELRHNVTAYDASYVVLAEDLECTLVTSDRRLAEAPGLRCPIEVVPR